jgi:hypothetical protein
MSDPAVTIRFDGNQRVFAPGEQLSGYCRWEVEPKSDARRVELSVLWYTEGKGEEDFGVHYFDGFSIADDDEGTSENFRRFSTVLPNSPLSYDGSLVRICWCVRVRVFLRRGKELASERVFRLGQVPAVRLAVPQETA